MTDRLLTIANDRLRIGVVPDLGGRIAEFRRRTPRGWGPNALLFDLDRLQARRRPQTSFPSTARFHTWNGHVVWLGPQSDWWRQQDLNPGRRQRGNPWPPDPYLVRGACSVERQTELELVLRGPASPISGVQLRHRIRLQEDRVILQVTATNIRDTAVCWGLWFNTRVPAWHRAYTPVSAADSVQVAGSVPYAIDEGWFAFHGTPPAPGDPARHAKAFCDPRHATIACFGDRQCFVLRARRTPPQRVAPGQACIELFNGCTHDESKSLLELEWHAPYLELAPGQSMQAEQSWQLLADPRSVAGRRTLLQDLDREH